MIDNMKKIKKGPVADNLQDKSKIIGIMIPPIQLIPLKNPKEVALIYTGYSSEVNANIAANIMVMLNLPKLTRKKNKLFGEVE